MSRIMKLKIPLALLSIITVHTIIIKNVIRKPKSSSFQLGSADELLCNALQTGDMILFSRTWYRYDIPTAIMIQLYKTIYQCDYDHIGIIIVNQNTGIPYIYENTPFIGYQYRSFEERIRNSQSTHITIVPFKPILDLTNHQKLQLNEYINHKITDSSKYTSNEIIENLIGFYNYFMNYKLFHNTTDIYVCSNMKLISNIFQSIHINIINKSINTNIRSTPSYNPTITTNTTMYSLSMIENRNIQLLCEDSKKIYNLNERDIMVRSS